MKRAFLASALIGVAVMAACGKGADTGVATIPADSGGGGCKTSADCTGGVMCINAVCGTLCTSASQCAAGQACVNSACGACTADAQCGAGQACKSGACSVPGAACSTTSPCPAGKACVAGSCGPCATADQCPAGQGCVAGGACGPCTTNTECARGETCAAGTCQGSSTAVDAAGGGDAGPVDSGPDACSVAKVYAGKYPNAPCNWGSIPGVGALTGIAAGNAACASAAIGSHFCDYEELKKAVANGELSTVSASAWIHRTTVEKVSPSALGDYAPDPLGQASNPGAGARCNDWVYNTNHINNGEYVDLRAGLSPIYHLAPSTQTVVNDPASGAMGTSTSTRTCGPAASHFRDLLCCAPKPAGCQ